MWFYLRREVRSLGDTVAVRLYDAREVIAKVTAVVDSVTGREIHILYKRVLIATRLKERP